MRRNKLFITFTIIIASVLPAFSQYEPAKYIHRVGDGTGFFRDLKAGDLNGDGLPDIVAARTNPYRIDIYTNLGNGEFKKENSPDHGGWRITCIAIVNADNDPMPDIVFGTEEGRLEFLPNRNGNFGEPILLALNDEGIFFTDIIVEDFDDDGIKDLLILEHFYASLALGKPEGGYHQKKNLIAEEDFTEYYSFAAGDFNRDGLTDFAISSGGYHIYLNLGDGEFSKSEYVFDSLIMNITAGDLNGDGISDIVAKTPNFLVWRLAEGNGTFSPARFFNPSEAHFRDFFLTDVDDDGDLDLVAVYDQFDNVVWFKNDGFGNFAEEKIIHNESGAFLSHIIASDINQDGKLDLIWGGTLGVLAFNLHSDKRSSADENNLHALCKIYSSGNAVFAEVPESGYIHIYSVTGKLEMSHAVIAGENRFAHNLSAGAYYAVYISDASNKRSYARLFCYSR